MRRTPNFDPKPLTLLFAMVLSAGTALGVEAGCTGPPLLLASLPAGNECRAARAFLAVQESGSRAAIERHAREFEGRFPHSRFLYWVYDVWARTAKGDFIQLNLARKSLHLRPENPALHVFVADTCRRQRIMRCELESLAAALVHSENLAAPESVLGRDWMHAADQPLLAGRLARLLYLGHPRRPWNRSVFVTVAARVIRSLIDRLEVDTSETVAAYVTGAQGAPREVLAPLLVALRRVDQDTQTDARRTLAGRSALEWRSATAAAEKLELEASANLGPVRDRRPALYAGSASCAESGCHPDTAKRWQANAMYSVLETYATALKQNWIAPGLEHRQLRIARFPVARARRTDVGLFVDLWQNNDWRPFPVSYVVGKHREQAFLTKGADGELYVLPVQFYVKTKAWFVYGEPTNREAMTRVMGFRPTVEAMRRGDAQVYRLQCMRCHTSDFRWKEKAFVSSFGDPGVNCEECHGPSKPHAIWRAANKERKGRQNDDPAPVLTKTAGPREYESSCMACHSHTGYWSHDGEYANRTGERWPFMPAPKRLSLDRYSAKAFGEDGALRQSAYLGESMRRTKCYILGDASCGSCHLVHPQNQNPAVSNPMKYGALTRRLCTQCHTQPHKVTAETIRPKGLQKASGPTCIECHMPQRVLGPGNRLVRDHDFDNIPKP